MINFNPTAAEEIERNKARAGRLEQAIAAEEAKGAAENRDRKASLQAELARRRAKLQSLKERLEA